MLSNYLKIAIRNLTRNKGFSFINIAGLAIGMASALLITLWVQNELSIDRIYPKTDRLYMLYNRGTFSGETHVWNQTPKSIVPELKKHFPAAEDATRYLGNRFLVTVGNTHLNSIGGIVDSGFLNMFGFPLLEGDAGHALSQTFDIVLTQQLAKKLFGKQDPVGRSVRLDSNADFTVTGVLKDLPSTTSFNFEYLLPWSYLARLGWNDEQNWGNNSVATFVLLKNGVSQLSFDKQVGNITRSHSNETAEVFTQPISRLHLYDKRENGHLVADKIVTVRLFLAIAGFILLIACINFMNLSTARSERRAREVGIRKVVGAVRQSLIAQFIGESILIAAIAFVIAVFLAEASLHTFNRLVGKELSIGYSSPSFWIFSVCFILLTGLLAGSYPAFYLSAFRPVSVLKGSFKKVDRVITPRKILVVLQFSFAIILIICTSIVSKQLRYGMNRDSGYNRDQLVYFFAEGQAHDHMDDIRNDLLNSGAAISATISPGPITQHWSDSWLFEWPGSTPADQQIDFLFYATESDFVKTMGLTLLSGRDIDVNTYKTDSNAVLLNESAVKTMRLHDPVGKLIRQAGSPPLRIVGVIKDFILESPFTKKVAPMIITGPNGVWLQVIHFKLNPAHSTAADLAIAEKIYHKYNPAYPFDYKFVDEAYAQKFKTEQQTTKMSAWFTALTIVISCLGLFALAAYTAENRIREIGVRKVLGASVTGITTLLTREFIGLVLIAFLIATPIAWLVMDKWLLEYSYRIRIGWEVFAGSGLLAVTIAVATVSYQAIKAARMNPIKSLRTE